MPIDYFFHTVQKDVNQWNFQISICFENHFLWIKFNLNPSLYAEMLYIYICFQYKSQQIYLMNFKNFFFFLCFLVSLLQPCSNPSQWLWSPAWIEASRGIVTSLLLSPLRPVTWWGLSRSRGKTDRPSGRSTTGAFCTTWFRGVLKHDVGQCLLMSQRVGSCSRRDTEQDRKWLFPVFSPLVILLMACRAAHWVTSQFFMLIWSSSEL